jgi:hypothetical protein
VLLLLLLLLPLLMMVVIETGVLVRLTLLYLLVVLRPLPATPQRYAQLLSSSLLPYALRIPTDLLPVSNTAASAVC